MFNVVGLKDTALLVPVTRSAPCGFGFGEVLILLFARLWMIRHPFREPVLVERDDADRKIAFFCEEAVHFPAFFMGLVDGLIQLFVREYTGIPAKKLLV